MNVVFISPNFPTYYYNFTKQLKDLGVNVLGIGDSDYYFLSDECKDSLNEYYKVANLSNYEEVYRACGYFTFKYGKIGWIESQNEYWLELEASLRSDFNVSTGTKIDELASMKYKSKMKEVYQSIGIPVARHTLIINNDMETALSFIKEVGYPVVVKPDNGVGANDTFKLNNQKQLENFFDNKENNKYIMEEFIDGDVETFDGITNSKKEILICSSHKMLVSIMDSVNESKEMHFMNQAVEKSDIYQIGKKVVEAFDTRSRFFHFEFFRLSKNKKGLGNKGDLIALEVNMRAPGAYIPEMINCSYNENVYSIWANMLVNDELDHQPIRKYRVGYASRRNNLTYLYNKEEIIEKYGKAIVLNVEVPKALSGAMGDYVFIFRDVEEEKIVEIMNDIKKKK